MSLTAGIIYIIYSIGSKCSRGCTRSSSQNRHPLLARVCCASIRCCGAQLVSLAFHLRVTCMSACQQNGRSANKTKTYIFYRVSCALHACNTPQTHAGPAWQDAGPAWQEAGKAALAKRVYGGIWATGVERPGLQEAALPIFHPCA